MKKLLLFALVQLGLSSSSQTQDYLDINNVKALIMNRNDMFHDLFSGNSSYEVPKNSGKMCMYGSSVWIGGIDAGNQLHMAGMTYRQNGVDFWPGPLDTLTGNVDNATSAQFDRVWKVSSAEINSFILAYANGSVTANTYTPAADILSWPAHGNTSSAYSKYIAPFVDVNADGLYNPLHGDFPKIKGDQMIFYVCNDNKSLHTETQGLALGVEVQVSAYAYGCPSILTAYPELNHTTFYHYKIINRSNNHYSNMMMGIWSDVDIGYFADDHIGCDTSLNIGYAYNADNYDQTNGSSLGYLNYPPIQSCQILKGPLAPQNDGRDNNHNGIIDEALEDTRFNNFMFYNNNVGPFVSATTNPNNAGHYYNYMKSIWKDGLPLRADSAGRLVGATAPPTAYAYPGDPSTLVGWSEYTRNNQSGDRRFIIGNGPFSMLPGETRELEFSFLTTFDSTLGGYKNLTKMKNENAVIANFYSLANKPSCINLVTNLNENQPKQFEFYLAPNPTKEYITLYSNKSLNGFEFRLLNNFGQMVFSQKLEGYTPNIVLNQIPKGLYFAEVKGEGIIRQSKLIVE